MLPAATRATPMSRPSHAYTAPVLLQILTGVLRLPYPPQFWRQRKSQMSRQRVSLTWGSKKKLDKKKKNLYCWIRILLNTNYFCVCERIVKLLNHNHEELFSSKTKVRQEFWFFIKRDKSESLALLVISFFLVKTVDVSMELPENKKSLFWFEDWGRITLLGDEHLLS